MSTRLDSSARLGRRIDSRGSLVVSKGGDPGNALMCELCLAKFDDRSVLEACDDCGRDACPECRSESPWDGTVIRCKECWGSVGESTRVHAERPMPRWRIRD